MKPLRLRVVQEPLGLLPQLGRLVQLAGHREPLQLGVRR